jgi:hypothetical protein
MLERQVAWLRALEDLVDVRGRAPKIVDQVRSVAHQAPGFDVFAELAYRGQPMLERLCRDSTRLLQEEPIGQNDGGIGAFFRHHGEFALDFLYRACLRQHDLNPDLLRGGHDPYHSRGMPRVLRLHQHGDTRQFWHGRLQQLEQFRPEVEGADRQAGDVPTGPRHARGKALADRITHDRADDGNGHGGVLQRAVDGRPRCHDDVNFQTHQFRGEGRKALGFPVSEACLNDEVRTLDIAELAHALHERIVAAGIQRRLARSEVEKPDARNFRLLLGE